YKERLEQGFAHEDIMESIYVKGRDNARTPMQWSAESQAGFTAGEPWIEVNPNHSAINVENDKNSNKSIYQFYKKLIKLRKENDLIIYGDYKLLDSEPEIFAYARTYENEEWRVVCNFTGKEIESSLLCDGEIVIHNYETPGEKLRPYEVIVYKLKN
ncbi:MAG: alpha-glucosidase C-terminal domain-containing protein, partial [Mesobacillus sp.]